MPTNITGINAFSGVQAPANGEAVDAPALVTQSIQPLANRTEYLRQLLEVSGAPRLIESTQTLMQFSAPPAYGSSAIVQVSGQGGESGIWLYDATSLASPLYGYVVKPTSIAASSPGRWLNVGAFVYGPPTFQTPRRVYVNVPMSAFIPRVFGSGGASQLDNTNYAYVYPGNGIRRMVNNASAIFEFRTRLPTGRLAGVFAVLQPNMSGTAVPGATNILTAQPMLCEITQYTGANQFQYADVMPYDTSGLSVVSSVVWSGGSGGSGENVTSAHQLSAQSYQVYRMLANTTATTGSTTYGGPAIATDADKEYSIRIYNPTFSGTDYTTLFPNGFRPVIFKLEVAIDVTTMGAA